MEKIKISLPIVVEGRYDKSTLSGFIDGVIITTEGFGIFSNKEKQTLIRRLGKDGIILLTDSDGGGKQIRAFLKGILPPDKIHNLYIPNIEGKERRKRKPSAQGYLGVEGMEKDVLLKILSPFIDGKKAENTGKMITKVDFFEDNLTGCPDASANRSSMCRMAELPEDMNSNALLEAMNLLYGYDGYKELVSRLTK